MEVIILFSNDSATNTLVVLILVHYSRWWDGNPCPTFIKKKPSTLRRKYKHVIIDHFILVHLFNCFLTVTENRSIKWQELNSFRHLDWENAIFWSSNWATEWGRKILVTECGIVVGVRRACLFSGTADLLRILPKTVSQVNREWSKNEKISCGQ